MKLGVSIIKYNLDVHFPHDLKVREENPIDTIKCKDGGLVEVKFCEKIF